jgi:hypothetical protein
MGIVPRFSRAILLRLLTFISHFINMERPRMRRVLRVRKKIMKLRTGTLITLASKRNFPRTASALALIMLCPLLLLLTGCEWPIYRDGPGRTGQSGVNTSANTGTLQWNYSVGLGQNELPYGPVVGLASSAGGIYLGDELGNIYSITTTGKLAWTTATNAVGATPNAIGSDLSVYAPQVGGSLYDVTSSGVQWTFSPPGGLSPANLAIAYDSSGTIYTGNQCGVFYALNPNGTVKWTYGGFQRECDLYTPTISAAVAPDGTIYAGVIYANEFPEAGVLFALSSSGSLLWSSTVYVGTPAVANNGSIYVLGLGGEQLYALNSKGTLQWQVNAPGEGQFSLPAIAPDGTAYVGTAGDGLWAINAHGSVVWVASPGGRTYFFAPPTLGGDGTIYATALNPDSGTSSLLALNPNSTLKWSTVLCAGATGTFASSDEPVIGLDGAIYLILDGFTNNVASCPLQAFQ